MFSGGAGGGGISVSWLITGGFGLG